MRRHIPKTAKVLGFFLALTFLNTLLASETINLKFLDLWDYSMLPGVKVEYENYSTISDSTGEVKLTTEQSGSINFVISLNGYYAQNIQLEPNTRQKTVYLQPLEQVANIQITANRPNSMNIDMTGPNAIIRLSAQNAKPVAALLDNSTAVFVKNYGAGSALKTISMRGFGAEHTALTYDGININNQQLGLTELGLLNLQNVSTIELYRGGNSSLFGSGAIAGAINFVPSLPVNKFQYAVSNTYGSWNSIQNSIMINFTAVNLIHRVSLNRLSGDNNYPFSFNDKIYHRQNSDQKYFQVGYSLYHPSTEILAEVILSKNSRGVAKQVLDRVNENDFARQKDNSIFTRLKWIPFKHSQLQLYWMQQENIYDDSGLIINNQILHSEHTNDVCGLQFSKSLVFFDQIRSFTKFEIEKSFIKSTDAGKHDRLRLALSSILEKSICKIEDMDLKLSGSFRWENYSETANTLLPKFGFTASNANFNFYSSYGYNYRIPTFNELYWQPGGNPKLQSEESNSFETGIYYSDDFAGKFTLTLDYYRNEIKNMIRWVPDNQSALWSPMNISAVKGEGVELGLNYELFSDFLYLSANYSYSQTTKTKAEFLGDNSVNNQVPYIPREMGNLGLKLKWMNWFSNINWGRTGFRYLSFANSSDEFLPSHNILNLDLGYEFIVFDQKCNINLQIDNLLDKNYQVMYGYPMPGRNFNISLVIQN